MGLLGVVGEIQGYLDPGRFYDASDRPALHWLQAQFDLGSRLQIMVNSYVRGSLTIMYSSLPTRGRTTRGDHRDVAAAIAPVSLLEFDVVGRFGSRSVIP